MEDRISSVEQSLARIEVHQIHLERQVDSVLENQAALQLQLQKVLHGDHRSPGLVVRTDRLEQWKTRSTAILSLILGAVIPLVANKAWEMMQ